MPLDLTVRAEKAIAMITPSANLVVERVTAWHEHYLLGRKALTRRETF